MAAISSTGVGSGLDVKSIVSQLVAIEKQPLVALQTKASTIQAQLSLYGTVKSQSSALADAATVLSGTSGWNTQKASSSNATAVGVTAGTTAVAAVMSVEVSQLARAQSSASTGVTAGSAANAAGNLKIELGSWSSDAVPAFTATGSVSVAVIATDTMSDIASKINAGGAGVTASVLRDGANERLVIRSATTGTAAGFRLNTPADTGIASLGLANPSDGAAFTGQTALNAKVKINGVAVESATNKMADVTTGVALQLNQVTTGAVDITVGTDSDVIGKNIQTFVDTYNALNSTLANATKYTAATKVGGVLQGDSVTTGLQNSLRSILGSYADYADLPNDLAKDGSRAKHYLSDVGITRQTDGSLKIDATKLDAAKLDVTSLKRLFFQDNTKTTNTVEQNKTLALTNGVARKVKDFAHALLAFDGRVTNKATALQSSINRNLTDQDKVTARASMVETQLLKQYTALDTKMSSLSGLSSYVTAQLAQWNKSSA